MRELDRLNTMFDASIYALVILPFLMIALAGSVPPVLGLAFVAALPASWWVHRRRLARPEHAVWFNVVVVGFLVVTAVQLFATDLALLGGGIQFVLVLTIIKLFSRLAERDEMQLFALSFLGLAAATTVNEDVTFGLLFALYVLIGTFGLAVFHLRSELAARPRLALLGTKSTINRGYIAVLLSMGAIILGASLAVFFLFPRLGLGFFAPQDRDGVSVAGFNDEVELGGHGAVRDNPEVVMRVEFPEGAPVPETGAIHWRTLSFDAYDGKRWSRTLPDRGRGLPTHDDVADLSRVHHSTGPGLKLNVYLEPIGKNVLPVVRPTHAIRLGSTKFVLRWGPRAGHLRRDWYDDIHHTIASEVGIAYELTLGQGIAAPADGLRTPPAEFMQLPTLSARVRDLARRITQNAGTNAEKADAIVRHLQSSTTYTTELPRVGDDPIDAFLFETRRGHCEYFATATVLLLRESGVPARLVNGFLGGQWNEVGGYLAVRQGDAHSWAEYWDPVVGWTEIDATPASDDIASNALIDTARAAFDAARLKWMKWVIEYDLGAQIDVFRRIAAVIQPRGLMGDEGGASDDRDDDGDDERLGDWRRALFVAGLATLAYFGFQRTRRRLRRRDHPARTTLTATTLVGFGMAWTGWWNGFAAVHVALGGGVVALGVLAALASHTRNATLGDAFEALERAGRRTNVARRDGEGPGSYLERLAAANPHVEDDLARFRIHYLRARFGTDAVEPEAIVDLRRRAERIAGKLRTTDPDRKETYSD